MQKEEFKVLYMEDDAGLARLLQKNLHRRGYLVDIAENGEAGVAMAAQGAYDIVLVDYEMPLAGGVDVLRHLTGCADAPPVIMLTGKGSERVAVEALKLGATDYIVKDPDMEYLELLPIVMRQVLWKRLLIKEKEHILSVIQESEERYRKLVELSPDGIAIIVKRRFVFINPAGVTLLDGTSAEDLIGTDLLDRLHELSREQAAGRLAASEEQGQAIAWVEEKMLKLDGRQLDVEMAAVPFLYQGEGALQLIFRDITERRVANERLEQLAHFDHLTMLPNRALFFDRLGYLLDQARRYDFPFALLFLDLDHFKAINDTLGHATGDLLLKQAAERLSGCLRRSDTVARMGGDEFTIILSRLTEPADAAIVAKKLLKAFEASFMLKEEVWTVGASIGISLYPDDGDSPDVLLKKADTAMYRAKEGGRNRYCYFSA